MTGLTQITVPIDLLKNWEDRFHDDNENVDVLLIEAYEAGHRAGADQELEACCEWVATATVYDITAYLRAARRPKPPSLKEQALEQLKGIEVCFRVSHGGDLITDTIRRALEQLDD